MDSIKFNSVEQYLDSLPESKREIAEKMRNIIKSVAPDSEETISYNMPAYKQNGVLVYFAAAKKHLGFYPTSLPINVFSEELSPYHTSKGAIQLPYDKELPVSLIKKIVEFRINENLSKPKKSYIRKRHK